MKCQICGKVGPGRIIAGGFFVCGAVTCERECMTRWLGKPAAAGGDKKKAEVR